MAGTSKANVTSLYQSGWSSCRRGVDDMECYSEKYRGLMVANERRNSPRLLEHGSRLRSGIPWLLPRVYCSIPAEAGQIPGIIFSLMKLKWCVLYVGWSILIQLELGFLSIHTMRVIVVRLRRNGCSILPLLLILLVSWWYPYSHLETAP